MNSAYFYDDQPGAEAPLHKGASVSSEVLASLGIQIIPVPQQGYEARLKAIAAQRGYPADIDIQAIQSTSAANEKTWSTEHIFLNEVMWYTLQSNNFVDFRDLSNNWIRVPLTANTLYITPAGIFNRYISVDKNESALVLSKGQFGFVERKGTELDNHPVRLNYLNSVGK
ncbi:hypothetical protein E1B28_011987 [Marasmius oreades]|uniref:Uncharacterized protein n=1 Tax=Marasmius oreades TaxID=181124 RepID=A0A9P7RRW1_9AGAR|nr:uncharacterized protein E1B28_011987 [Marasmius oreades]KAG7087943.1 hypothetical protein E1B28_011987 [Marasmius oreades]